MDEISYKWTVNTYGFSLYIPGHELLSGLITGSISCIALLIICSGLFRFFERTTKDENRHPNSAVPVRFLIWAIPILAAMVYFLPLIYMNPSLRMNPGIAGLLNWLSFIICGLQILFFFALFRPLKTIGRAPWAGLWLIVPIYNMVVSWKWANEAFHKLEKVKSQGHHDLSLFDPVIYHERGQYDQVISNYTKALETNPKDATVYSNRGGAYVGKGDYDQAISDCNKALVIDPKLAEAYANRGLAYSGKGQYDQAISDFNKAIEINPKLAEAYYIRGNAWYDKGELDRAIADYHKALEIDPRYADAYINRGVAYFFKNEYDQGWADVHKAQELGSQVPPEVLKNLQSLTEVLKDLREASGRQG